MNICVTRDVEFYLFIITGVSLAICKIAASGYDQYSKDVIKFFVVVIHSLIDHVS